MAGGVRSDIWAIGLNDDVGYDIRNINGIILPHGNPWSAHRPGSGNAPGQV